MKTALAAVLIVMLATVVGCNQGTTGGPGASDPNAGKPGYGQVEDSFNLSVPLLPVAMKQGEKKTAAISINRGKNFDEEVALRFSDLPKGVSMEPSSPLIRHGDTEAKLTFSSSKAAALGSFTILVTGHPTKGQDATTELKMSVDKM